MDACDCFTRFLTKVQLGCLLIRLLVCLLAITMNILGHTPRCIWAGTSRRINRKVLSWEPHCLTPEPLFPDALLFAEGDRKIVLASVKIRVTRVFASPSLPGRKTNRGTEQTAYLPHLSRGPVGSSRPVLASADFGPNRVPGLAVSPASSSSVACLLGCLAPMGSSPPLGHPGSWTWLCDICFLFLRPEDSRLSPRVSFSCAICFFFL